MKLCLAVFMLGLLAQPLHLAAQMNCDAPPTLQIFDARIVHNGDTLVADRAIEGKVLKDGQPLRFGAVRLYSRGKLVQRTSTDWQGQFSLDNLSLGRYRLSFTGMGSFTLEVIPPHVGQQFHYGFSSDHGCVDWAIDAD